MWRWTLELLVEFEILLEVIVQARVLVAPRHPWTRAHRTAMQRRRPVVIVARTWMLGQRGWYIVTTWVQCEFLACRHGRRSIFQIAITLLKYTIHTTPVTGEWNLYIFYVSIMNPPDVHGIAFEVVVIDSIAGCPSDAINATPTYGMFAIGLIYD